MTIRPTRRRTPLPDSLAGTSQPLAGTDAKREGGPGTSKNYTPCRPNRKMPTSTLSVWTEFGLGAFLGLIDCTLFHWIDTLKVRAQDRRPLLMDLKTGAPLCKASLGIPRFALAAIQSLYAGFSTNLSLKLPYMAFMFAFSTLNARLLSALDGGGAGSNIYRELTGAALVGVEVSLILSPLEMVRIQGQNMGKGGLVPAARAVHATASAGVLGWFSAWTRGMTATINRESKYCIGQFFLCEKIAEALSARNSGSERADGATARAGLASQVAGAVLGGLACTAISHPDDVIKTRMQTHLRGSAGYASYASFLGSGRYILQHEGLRALFNGAAFRCLLRVPLGLSVIIVTGSALRERLETRDRSSSIGAPSPSQS